MIKISNPASSPVIWDLPLRLFHWLTVFIVFVAAITGYLFEEWWLNIHVYAGYCLMSLLGFRILWGALGSYYSRFHTFPLSPVRFREHLKNLLIGKVKSYEGHNPVGAWMIVFLLMTLLILVVSGLIVWGGQENNGPLAQVVGYQLGELTEELHELFANFLLVLIFLHVSGVILESALLKRNLIKAMITGKRNSDFGSEKTQRHHYLLRGFIVFVTVVISLTYWVNSKSSTIEIFEVNSVYLEECGGCHVAYHPSLRTQKTWQSLLSNLSDHYGEDASLDEHGLMNITRYLMKQSAHFVDSESAHNIGRQETQTMRITDTSYWKKRHKEINEGLFSSPNVGSKINCNACHSDADSGRFDDVNINLPEEAE